MFSFNVKPFSSRDNKTNDSMDASSVITQVARSDEQANYPSVDRGNVNVNGGNASKKPERKNVFKNLFCCCFAPRRLNNQSANGSCVPDNGAPYSHLPPAGLQRHLLNPLIQQDFNKKCMIIDLDETLVHSSFKPISNADFIVPVEIDGTIHQVYVLKRPFVDDFLQKMGELYECVLFTASLAKYADPVANLLDKWGVFRARLFRESCVFHRGNYVKDLSRLGRELHKIVILDNSPASYIFHPDNAVSVSSWFDDMSDSELVDLIPFLETLSKVDNVYSVLRNCNNPLNNTSGMQSSMTLLPTLTQGPLTQVTQLPTVALLQQQLLCNPSAECEETVQS